MATPKMTAVGSVAARMSLGPACGPFQFATVTQVISAVNPTVMITNMISVQVVDRTDLIFVHSACMSRPKPALRVGGCRCVVAGE
jgi:hypothetical protein